MADVTAIGYGFHGGPFPQDDIYEGEDIQLTDSDYLRFGNLDGGDASMGWDGTNLTLKPGVDDTGALVIGDGTTDFDVKVFLGTSAKYVLFDVGNVLLTLEDVDLKCGDNDAVLFGDASDVSIKWNATNLTVLPVADDTGAIYFGDGTTDMDVRFTLGAAADYVQMDVGAKALQTAGTARVTLNGVASSGVTDGSVLRMGTSGAPLTDDQAGAGFVVGYFDCGDAAGWPAGLYISTNVTGAGGSFTALQGDAVVSVAKAVVTGVECFMQFATAGAVTGRASAMAGCVDFGNYAFAAGGCYTAGCFSIKGEGSSVNLSAPQRVACVELRNEGTYGANSFEVKTAGYAIYFNGFTAASGVTNILSSTRLAELPASTVGIRVGVGADGASGTAYYIPLVLASEWN